MLDQCVVYTLSLVQPGPDTSRLWQHNRNGGESRGRGREERSFQRQDPENWARERGDTANRQPGQTASKLFTFFRPCRGRKSCPRKQKKCKIEIATIMNNRREHRVWHYFFEFFRMILRSDLPWTIHFWKNWSFCALKIWGFLHELFKLKEDDCTPLSNSFTM